MPPWSRDAGSPVLAKTVYQSASRTPDIQHLAPVKIQPPEAPSPSPSDTARRPHAGHVAPGLRLGEAEAGPELASGDAGEVPLLLVVVPGDEHRADGQSGEEQHEGGRVRVLGHLLNGQGETEDAGPRAAEFGRKAEAEQVGIAEGVEDVLSGTRRWCRSPAALGLTLS